MALEILQDQKETLKKQSDAFNVYSYSACMTVCGAEGQWEKALQLLNELINHPDPSVGPNIPCYGAAITACRHSKQWREALRVFEHAKASGLTPDENLYRSIMHACSAAGEWETAINLLEEMKLLRIRLTPYDYNAAMNACTRAGKCDEALELFEKMAQTKTKPDGFSYFVAIRACGIMGKVDQAISLNKLLISSGESPRIGSYKAIINGCADAGRLSDVLKLWDEMQQHRISPDEILYNSAIRACDSAGDWKKALSFLNEMKSNGMKPFYKKVLGICFSANQFAPAFALFKDAYGQMTPQYVNGDIRWDLRRLSASACCILVSKILLDTSLERRQGLHEPGDIVFITGKGTRLYQETQSTLNTILRQFLDEHSGPSLLDRDDSRLCVITNSHFEEWLESDNFAHFQKKMTEESIHRNTSTLPS